MARKTYLKEDGTEKNIGAMTTRELRGYIYDKSREAQKRLDTVNLDDASKAFKNAADVITNKYGKVLKSTSYLNKKEMQQMAYDLRQFASLDTTSKFAKSIEWQQNKEKYKSFIRKQLEDPLFRNDFMKYLTPAGKRQYSEYFHGERELKDVTGISQKGYQEYKNYISFLSNISTVIESYGYETIKQYAVESKKDPQRAKVIERLLFKIYEDGKGKGWTQAELAKKFSQALDEYDKRSTAAGKVKTKTPTVKTKRSKKSSSGTIRIKQAGKMRTNGSVRERLT